MQYFCLILNCYFQFNNLIFAIANLQQCNFLEAKQQQQQQTTTRTQKTTTTTKKTLANKIKLKLNDRENCHE